MTWVILSSVGSLATVAILATSAVLMTAATAAILVTAATVAVLVTAANVAILMTAAIEASCIVLSGDRPKLPVRGSDDRRLFFSFHRFDDWRHLRDNDDNNNEDSISGRYPTSAVDCFGAFVGFCLNGILAKLYPRNLFRQCLLFLSL